jgi:hypothetical protein
MDTNMKFIQEEAKKRFPIGCEFIPVGDGLEDKITLIEDYTTYEINRKRIYTHYGCGCLYDYGKWAKLIDDNGNVVDFDLKPNSYEIY